MNTARPQQPAPAKIQGPRLSPELNEFLHMLTALEQQVQLPPSWAPSSR